MHESSLQTASKWRGNTSTGLKDLKLNLALTVACAESSRQRRRLVPRCSHVCEHLGSCTRIRNTSLAHRQRDVLILANLFRAKWQELEPFHGFFSLKSRPESGLSCLICAFMSGICRVWPQMSYMCWFRSTSASTSQRPRAKLLKICQVALNWGVAAMGARFRVTD